MDNVIGFTDYLESRSFNRKVLNNIGTAITPAVNQFNESNDRQVKLEWSMSAKYQSGTLYVTMEDDDELSDQVRYWIEAELCDQLEEWFDYWFDEDEVRSTYASLSVGF